MRLRSYSQLFQSRLSRKIVASVFLSIVAIEVLIFIPAYRQRRIDKLQELEAVSQEVLFTIKSSLMADMAAATLLPAARSTLKPDSVIVGAALYDLQGQLLDTFGEVPELAVPPGGLSEVVEQVDSTGQRYDVAWPSQQFQDRYGLVIRHDATGVQRYMMRYSIGITCLVILISAFVTAVTMLVLGRLVITPLLLLRDDLCAAADAVHQPRPPAFASLKCAPEDELGEVIRAFAFMFEKISQEVRERLQAEAALRSEQEKAEALLQNVLPSAIANRLKNDLSNRTAIASRYDNVTILFADIVGFTSLAAHTPPTQLVCQLNDIFSAFDALAERHGLEKIKTIGDAYMVVGGVPQPMENHAAAVVAMAMDMQAVVRKSRHPFKLRIGINSGPVVAGVIGIKKFSYDLWGDAVNVASRMESHGVVDRIQVSATTYEQLKEQYSFEDRGSIQVKGRGEMHTYLLTAAQEVKENAPSIQPTADQLR